MSAACRNHEDREGPRADEESASRGVRSGLPNGKTRAPTTVSAHVPETIERGEGRATRAFPRRARRRCVGVLNVTPDSFSDGGRFTERERVRWTWRGRSPPPRRCVDAGAHVIDVGGESTRPGAARRAPKRSSTARTIPVIEALAEQLGRTDLDRHAQGERSREAAARLPGRASIVNDVSGLQHDRAHGLEVAARYGGADGDRRSPAWHARDHAARLRILRRRVVRRGRPMSSRRSLELARSLPAAVHAAPRGRPGDRLRQTSRGQPRAHRELRRCCGSGWGCPLLIGASRKGFLGTLTERSRSTSATPLRPPLRPMAIFAGADAIRVHDVAGARASGSRSGLPYAQRACIPGRAPNGAADASALRVG